MGFLVLKFFVLEFRDIKEGFDSCRKDMLGKICLELVRCFLVD